MYNQWEYNGIYGNITLIIRCIYPDGQLRLKTPTLSFPIFAPLGGVKHSGGYRGEDPDKTAETIHCIDGYRKYLHIHIGNVYIYKYVHIYTEYTYIYIYISGQIIIIH